MFEGTISAVTVRNIKVFEIGKNNYKANTSILNIFAAVIHVYIYLFFHMNG